MNFFEFFRDKELFVSFFLYLLLGVVLFDHYAYILNSDGISYISIAQHYLAGRFDLAINGYWGPLYTWLLIPFLYFWPGKLEAIFATKALALILGLVAIYGIYRLSMALNFDSLFRWASVLTAIPITLYFAFNFITPDLLVVCILLLFYMDVVLSPEYCKNLSHGVIAGLTGGMAFLSKSYVFFFFLAHFILINIYYLKSVKLQRKIILKNLLIGLTVFLVISGVWVALISDKYDKFTIGTSGAYNYNLVGPSSEGHPMLTQGLMPPSNPYAVSIWEDPTFIKINSWSPLKSNENFNHQLDIIINNILSLLGILENFSVFSVFIIIFSLYFAIRCPKHFHNIFIILSAIIIYAGGYTLILLEERYLWFIDVLLLLLGLFCLKITFEKFDIRKTLSYFLIILLCLSFLVLPIIGLYKFFDEGKFAYNISSNLKNVGVNGNIASDDNWEATIYFCYYLDSRYYGVVNRSMDPNFRKKLNESNIEYYLVYSQLNSYLNNSKEIQMGNVI